MFEYVVTHWQALLLTLAVFFGPTVPFVLWAAVATFHERAYCKGYDQAWENAKRAQAWGKTIV